MMEITLLTIFIMLGVWGLYKYFEFDVLCRCRDCKEIIRGKHHCKKTLTTKICR